MSQRIDDTRSDPRTDELLSRNEPLMQQGEIIKKDARSALALLRDVVDTLRRTNIDLALIIDTKSQSKGNRS